MSGSRRAAQKGISLIEIPVAMLVLGIVLLIAARTFSTAGHVQSDSRSADQAMAFASAKLTELETMPLPGITDGRDQVAASDGPVYSRSWTVTRPIAGSEARSVRVEVQWQAGKAKDRIQVATLIR